MSDNDTNFDDLFADDDFDMSFEDDFPDTSLDDDLDFPEDDDSGGSGISRTFIILGLLFAIIFIVLSAIIAVIFLGGDDGPSENELLATDISGTNFAIETGIAASETALSEQSTATGTALVAIQATETQSFVEQSTATQEAVSTAVAATETQVSVDSTATQASIFVEQTSVALSLTPLPTDTPTPTETPDESITEGVGGGGEGGGEVSGELRDPDSGEPLGGVTLCVFADDGDSEFEPIGGEGDCASLTVSADDAEADPTEEATEEATEEPADTDDGTDDTDSDETINPIFATATAQAAGESGDDADADVEPVEPTVEPTEAIEEPVTDDGAEEEEAPPLNPIFATATAQAAAASGEAESGGLPPPPTQEVEGSSFVPYALAGAGRSVGEPLFNLPAQEDDGDPFFGEFITNPDGSFTISGLPEGTYWIKINDETLPITVTTEPQVLEFPGDTPDDPIVINVAGAGAGGVGGDNEDLSPIFQTSTAVALANQQGGGDIPSPTPDSLTTGPTDEELPSTGFFDGEGGNITATDLLILAVLGMILIGVVVAARRLRSPLG